MVQSLMKAYSSAKVNDGGENSIFWAQRLSRLSRLVIVRTAGKGPV